MAYQKSAQALLDAGAGLVNASRNVGFGVGMSATNYSQANAASTIGGGAAPLTPPEKPSEFDTPPCPSSLGGGVPPPFLWSVLQTFISDTWPDGDPGRLRASAGAWQRFASAINGIAGELSGPAGVIAGQQVPEGGAMTSALGELARSFDGVSIEAGNLATQIREFADDVESAQDAIRDLCDRISPSGLFDGIKAVFSGDALDEIKEIADDVKDVLENFGRQADGRIALMESLITALDDAVVSMQQKARREFTHYLGEDVGGALASQLEFRSNLSEGIVKAGLESIAGIQQLDPTRFASDPDGAQAAWGGLLDTLKYATPTGVAMDPMGALDHGKDMLSGLGHTEDWRADRPGLGLGGVLFEVGSAATGVGAAKSGLRGAGAAAEAGEAGPAVRAAAGAAEATAPIAGRASEIAARLDDLTTFPDDMPSGAASGAHGPALPPSLAEPGGPPTPKTPPFSESTVPQGVPHSVPDSAGPRPAGLPSQPMPDAGGSGAEVPPPHSALEGGTPSTNSAVGTPSDASSTSAGSPHDTGSGPSQPTPERTSTDSDSGLGHSARAAPSEVPASPPRTDSAPPLPTAPEPHPGTPHDSSQSAEAATHSDHGPPKDSEGQPDNLDGQLKNPAGDPLHSGNPEGDGWHRRDDEPLDPNYGHAILEDHWEYPDYPTDIDPEVRQLIADPDAPWGRDTHGVPLTKAEYESLFNKVGPDGQEWQNYPPNAGAAPGTRVVYDSMEAFTRDFGAQGDGSVRVDRLGKVDGDYLGLMPDGVPATFEQRSLPNYNLTQPYHQYLLSGELPTGWRVEVSEVAPAFAREGGGVQVLVLDTLGRPVTVSTLKEMGLLR
ncbi:glycohydrolase toxin TNT-related protein [Mycolicibacterium baixiangningiae]|uniref:glycohydrolase toxin TNT-related protein n=1 Tax=Mycolicibacterium baixiangningiae TaxID=2761578 RepID=UPI00186695C3|nr:glycohydrolase toxin TNT-related protein [Mycolicibacterium baixiangningiae]